MRGMSEKSKERNILQIVENVRLNIQYVNLFKLN